MPRSKEKTSKLSVAPLVKFRCDHCGVEGQSENGVPFRCNTCRKVGTTHSVNFKPHTYTPTRAPITINALNDWHMKALLLAVKLQLSTGSTEGLFIIEDDGTRYHWKKDQSTGVVTVNYEEKKTDVEFEYWRILLEGPEGEPYIALDRYVPQCACHLQTDTEEEDEREFQEGLRKAVQR